jgi:hypothetical protein
VPLAEVMAAAEAASNAGIRFEELRAIVSLGSGKSRSSQPSRVRTSELPDRFFLTPALVRTSVRGVGTFRLTVEVHDRGPLPAILRDAADRIEATPPDRKVSRSTSDTGGLVGSSCSWMTTRCDSR